MARLERSIFAALLLVALTSSTAVSQRIERPQLRAQPVPRGALSAYLTMTGETQGKINGSVTQAGRENWMEILGFSHKVASLRDVASGLPTGKRQHDPLTVTKLVDRATPLLMNVLTNSESLTDVRIDFWRPLRSGKEVQYFSIELVNARIAGISQEMAAQDPARLELREHVSLTYQKIIWTWHDGGITAEDDWQVPME